MQINTKSSAWALDILNHFDQVNPISGYRKEYRYDACGNQIRPGILHYESPEMEDVQLVCHFPVIDEDKIFSDRFELIKWLSDVLKSECSRMEFKFIPNFRYLEDFGSEIENSCPEITNQPHKMLVINGEFSPKK